MAPLLHEGSLVNGDSFARRHFCTKYALKEIRNRVSYALSTCKVRTISQNKRNRKVLWCTLRGCVLYVSASLTRVCTSFSAYFVQKWRRAQVTVRVKSLCRAKVSLCAKWRSCKRVLVPKCPFVQKWHPSIKVVEFIFNF